MNFKHFIAILSIFLLIGIASATPLPNVIGVYWDPGSSSSPTLSYIASDNSTIAAPDFNNTYPWSQMGRVNNSATQYQTMVWVPAFYYSSTLSGTIHKYFIYTGDPSAVPYGFSLHPADLVNGTAIPGFYFSAFEGSNYNTTTGYNRGDFSGVTLATDTLSSVAGSKPISGKNNSITLPQFRSLAQHRGTGWELQTFNQVSAIELLYLVEYHSFYSQLVLSQGVTQITDDGSTNMAVNTGATSGVGPTGSVNLINASGQVSILHYKTGQTTYPFSYRGIENFYGNIWKWADGINIKTDNNPWVSSYKYESDKFSIPYVNSGLTLLASPDYVKNTAYSSGVDYGFLAATGGGSSSTYLTNYYYPNSGDMAALLGGSWLNGLYCGPAYWSLYNPASIVYRYVGGRTSYVPLVISSYTYTTLSNTLSLTDSSYTISTITGVSGKPTSWNWSFGDGTYSTSQNPSHTYSTGGTYTVSLNASTVTDSAISTKSIKVGSSNTFTRQDLEMTQKAVLTVIFKDSSTGDLIPIVTVVDSNGYTETTTTGIYTHTYDFGTVVLYLASAGYKSKSVSYVLSGDRTETVTMIASSTSTMSQNTWWTPHTVQVTLMDTYGNRLTDVYINATYNETSMPTSWITQLYGIQNSPAADMVNSSLIMNGTTGSDGTMTFTMLGSIKYDFYMTSIAYGLNNYHVSAYPSDSMINFYIPTVASQLITNGNNTYQQLNGTRTYIVEPDIYNVSMCIDYIDSSGSTTSVTETWLFGLNQTLMHSLTFSPGVVLNTNCHTIPNVRGVQVWWGWNATRTGV